MAMGHVQPSQDGDYGKIAQHAVEKNSKALQFVDPEDCGDVYVAIAWIAVQKKPGAFEDVKSWDDAHIGAHQEVAELMVKHGDGSWLRYFDNETLHVDYKELARLAIEKNRGGVLQYVDPESDDYADIAKLAVQNDGLALEYVAADVFKDRDDYYRLAKIAVMENGEALQYVNRKQLFIPSRYKQLEALAWPSRRVLRRV